MSDKHYSGTQRFRAKAGELRRLYTESSEMSSDEFEDWLHGIFGVESLLELTMSEEAALGMIEEELKAWFGGQSLESNENAPNLDEVEVDLPTTPETAIDDAPEERSVTTVQNTSVSVRQNSTPVSYDPAKLNYIKMFADAVAQSGMFAGIDNSAKATIVMLKGLSLGMEPLDALSGFDLITDKNGKISLTPRVKLLRALVERTGLCLRFDVVGDAKKATATVQRKGRQPQTFTFTIEQAAKMGLTSKYTWERMPERMLAARVAGLAINSEFPDVNYGFGNNVLDAVDGDPEQ